MATVGEIPAGILTVFRGGTAVGCATQTDIEFSNELTEILCKDSAGWATYKGGKKTWSISIAALYAMDATVSGDDFYTELAADTSFAIEFATATSGDTRYTGNVLVSNLSINAGNFGESASYSCTLQGTDAPTKGLVTS